MRMYASKNLISTKLQLCQGRINCNRIGKVLSKLSSRNYKAISWRIRISTLDVDIDWQ